MQLSSELATQLAAVTKSSDGYQAFAPCRVTLRSGEVKDRVYVVDRKSFGSWAPITPAFEIEDVVRIESSPLRLPATFADELYAAGESGTGYTLFVARLRDGRRLPYVTGNAVDFPNWPPGVEPADVVSVEPHAGRQEFRDRAPGRYEKSADYDWCIYDA